MLSPTAAINERRKSPWHAAEFGELDVIKGIYDEQFSSKPKSADDQDDRGFTAVAWAARNGHYQVASYLIEEKKCNVEKSSFGGLRPLHHACNKMHEKLVRLLMRAGVDVNAEDDNGDTPLHYAASRGVVNIIVILLEANGDPTKANHQGVTPVHKAAIFGQIAVIKRLSEAGFNTSIMSVPDSQGDTPLHYAIRGGYPAMAKLLIELNADASKANKQGLTPKELASSQGMGYIFA